MLIVFTMIEQHTPPHTYVRASSSNCSGIGKKQSQQVNEVEEVIKELKTNPGFSAYVIMNNDGEYPQEQGYKEDRHAATTARGLKRKSAQGQAF